MARMGFTVFDFHRRPSRLVHFTTCEAASSSGRPIDNGKPIEQLVRNAQQAGKVASKKLKEVYIVVDNNVRRTATQVNTKYDVTGKAQQAASQLTEQAKVMENRVGLKRRMRNLADDVERKRPLWQKRCNEFRKTPLGQISFLAFIFFLFYTGLVFKLLNFLFILWWLAPFVLIPFTKIMNQRAEAEARRRAESQRQARAKQAPFFSNMFFRPRQQPGPQSPRKYDDPSGGPVIDVEYETLDDQ